MIVIPRPQNVILSCCWRSEIFADWSSMSSQALLMISSLEVCTVMMLLMLVRVECGSEWFSLALLESGSKRVRAASLQQWRCELCKGWEREKCFCSQYPNSTIGCATFGRPNAKKMLSLSVTAGHRHRGQGCRSHAQNTDIPTPDIYCPFCWFSIKSPFLRRGN